MAKKVRVKAIENISARLVKRLDPGVHKWAFSADTTRVDRGTEFKATQEAADKLREMKLVE